MSISRRIGRLLRAHWGALRHGPDEHGFSPEEVAGWSKVSQDRSSAPEEAKRQAVPPEVAAAYRALEVPVGSARAEVKKSYRRLMRTYHQDRFENDPDRRATATEVSKRLNLAYERVVAYLDEQEPTGS